MIPPSRPIVLLTDFGLDDWYVGAMKSEIMKRVFDARIIDLCHGIPPHDVAAGAFVLKAALGSLPEASVLCCVVDPGVGSARRAICGKIGDWYFAGPDNGLATALLEHAGAFDLHEITSPKFQAENPGATFHGRDLFAPAAAMLALGIPPRKAGPEITDPVRLDLDPEETPGGIRARVMLVDRFGNLITNLWREQYEQKLGDYPTISAGPFTIQGISKTFNDVEPGAPLAYWGSAGTLEIAVNQGSAADRVSRSLRLEATSKPPHGMEILIHTH
ncbi:MAG: SAM-dependent chlorinase/fluorinase [Candidatus Sumerlaeia bacterium]